MYMLLLVEDAGSWASFCRLLGSNFAADVATLDDAVVSGPLARTCPCCACVWYRLLPTEPPYWSAITARRRRRDISEAFSTHAHCVVGIFGQMLGTYRCAANPV